jgi:hypothetical protein
LKLTIRTVTGDTTAEKTSALVRALRTSRIAPSGMTATSRFKGVHRDSCGWRAQIHFNKKKITRRFKDELSAALFYNELALAHFGEFAVLNFI